MVTDRFVRTCSNNSTYFYNLFETLHDGQLPHNGHTSASQLRSLSLSIPEFQREQGCRKKRAVIRKTEDIITLPEHELRSLMQNEGLEVIGEGSRQAATQ